MNHYKILAFLLLVPALLIAEEDKKNDENPLSSSSPSLILNVQNLQEGADLSSAPTTEGEGKGEVRNNKNAPITVAGQPLSTSVAGQSLSVDSIRINDEEDKQEIAPASAPRTLRMRALQLKDLVIRNYPRYMQEAACGLVILGLNALPPILAGLSDRSDKLANASFIVNGIYTIIYLSASFRKEICLFTFPETIFLGVAAYYAALYKDEGNPYNRDVNLGLTCAISSLNQLLLLCACCMSLFD